MKKKRIFEQNTSEKRKRFAADTSQEKRRDRFIKKSLPPDKGSDSGSKGHADTLPETVRLNKYVADSGVSARRKAGELILAGYVTVNGVVVKEPGFRVTPGKDIVGYKGQTIAPAEKKVYLLMNKPKDAITSAADEKGRHTVMDIIGKSVKERIFPVGRLDRNTTGLLLLTNDGDLASKLSHPSHEVQKIYHAVLNKPISQRELDTIALGIELEDGVALIDEVSFVEGAPKNEVGIALHIGKNRIVRRIFEHLGYEVEKLDRVMYAGLTKKDLPRGRFRHLTEKEVILLKHFTGTTPGRGKPRKGMS